MTRTEETYNVPRGAAYLTSTQVVLYATYFIFYALLTRVLNPAEVGYVGILASAQAVFTTITSLSLPSAATRFISASLAKGDIEAAGGVARTVLKISIVSALAGLFLGGILSPLAVTVFSGPTNLGSILFVTFLAAFFLDLVTVYTGFFLGVGRYAATLYQNILYVPLSRGLGLIFALKMGVIGIVSGWAVGAFAALALSVYLWHSKFPRRTSYPARPLLAFSLPVLASSIIILAQQWGDIWVLQGFTANLATTGPYYIVVSSVTFLSILWIPLSQAIYPALSASHSTGQAGAVSDRLAMAFRLTNLAVLPTGAALAAVSPTALYLVYGPTYMKEALTLSILALAAVFTAQGALLFTTLQAVGRTRQYFEIALASTLVYVGIVAVGVEFFQIGTLAGAIGRALLAILIVLLARWSLHHTISAHTTAAMGKAILLGLGSGLPLLLVDQFFLRVNSFGFQPVFQLAVLAGLFVAAFAFVSRHLRVFHHGDFAIIRDALPRRLQPYLKIVQRLIIKEKQ
ncbi:MAG TPA: oligosaccharide flippase family protein [Candidatus Bathyarchaeia archaeon]|nr:oligosaccharide flippase family protein [Candidatus Bathyarchaeia archaeon]